ncbi:Monodehydroascorbate reductase (NADH) [Bertholletia excelsa]
MGQCWTDLCGSESEEDNELSSPVELARGNVYLINTTKGWEEKLTEASQDCKMVVANFSAPWCGPCREIAPAYCELANKYSSMIFLTVDVDELTEFSTSWDIKAFPTFFFLKDGQEVDKLVGANKQELQMKTAAIADSTAKLCK